MNIFDRNDVVVSQTRYDELLRKESLLDTVKTLHDRLTDYAFRDAVHHLFHTEVVNKDEQA